MVGELQCVSQPTDSTCVVRSWRLIDCFALTSAVRGFWEAWQCACVRYWPGRGLVYVCPLLYVCTNHNAVELSSIYFSSITVFHDTSKQIQQRASIGKIFARWHLAAIAITSLYGKTWPAHSIATQVTEINNIRPNYWKSYWRKPHTHSTEGFDNSLETCEILRCSVGEQVFKRNHCA